MKGYYSLGWTIVSVAVPQKAMNRKQQQYRLENGVIYNQWDKWAARSRVFILTKKAKVWTWPSWCGAIMINEEFLLCCVVQNVVHLCEQIMSMLVLI